MYFLKHIKVINYITNKICTQRLWIRSCDDENLVETSDNEMKRFIHFQYSTNKTTNAHKILIFIFWLTINI